MLTPSRSGKGCWYRITTYYCPVCLRETTYRERQYGTKPDVTHEWIQHYDWCEI